jgi:hypothetical protein
MSGEKAEMTPSNHPNDRGMGQLKSLWRNRQTV